MALFLDVQWLSSPAQRALIRDGSLRRWVKWALADEVRHAHITLRIVGQAEGRMLNAQYRGKDYATNVLTFDYSPAPDLAADLVLCAPVVAKEAKAQNKTLREHYAHLIVHGILHAQGYDHEDSEAEAEVMEMTESWLLLGLGMPDPYADAA